MPTQSPPPSTTAKAVVDEGGLHFSLRSDPYAGRKVRIEALVEVFGPARSAVTVRLGADKSLRARIDEERFKIGILWTCWFRLRRCAPGNEHGGCWIRRKYG